MCGSLGCCCGQESEEEAKRPMSYNPLKRPVCCTDVIFLIIFIAFWAGMIYIAAYSVMQGSALRFVHGYDSFGNTCNSSTNVAHPNISLSGQNTVGLSNVFFFQINDPFKKVQLCVKQCPDTTMYIPSDVYDFYKRTGSKLCYYTKNPEDYKSLSLSDFSGRGPCPQLPIPKSVSVANRCVPDLYNATLKVVEAIANDDFGHKVLNDLYACWKEMLVLCFVALAISLIMVFLIRYMATVIVWVIVALAIIGSIAATAFLWWTYVDLRGDREGKNPVDIPLLDIDLSNEKAFLWMAIIATVFTVILLLVILIMRKRIALVVALFHEAGLCLGSMPTLLLQPLWTFLILIVFFAYWVIILGFMVTAGELAPRFRGFAEDAMAATYKDTTEVRLLRWYHIVGLIWTSEFILACQQMVIAGAVVVWYFSRDKDNLSCMVGKATSRVILHHLGSVAFGSFIITLIKLPRLILMYIQNKCKGSESALASFCLKCCICCLWCLEKMLKFLNQNAYTIVAIEGKNFCSSARKAFLILTSNILRVAAINSVGDFVLFLAKVGVMATTTGIGILWLKGKPGLHFYALPALLVGVFGYLVSHCILSIYEMVIDTLLLCFCEDCNMNDGSDGREYFMSTSLMEFVKNTSSELDNGKKSKPAASPEVAEEMENLEKAE